MELSSLEGCPESFVLCTGTVPQCQSIWVYSIAGNRSKALHNTLLLLISVMFVYCLFPKQQSHLISLNFTKFTYLVNMHIYEIQYV